LELEFGSRGRVDVEQTNVFISAAITEHLTQFRSDLDALAVRLRAEMEVIRGLTDKSDLEERLASMLIRLNGLNDDLKIAMSATDLREIRALLETYRSEAGESHTLIGALRERLAALQAEIEDNRGGVAANKRSMADWEARLAAVRDLAADAGQRTERLGQELWRDQRRQDGEIDVLKSRDTGAMAVVAIQETIVALERRLNELGLQISGLDRLALIREIDERSMSNLEKIILLEERNQIQVEQANYVETVNSKMVQIEKEKVQNIADFRLESEKTMSAIDILREDLRSLLAKMVDHDSSLLSLREDLTGMAFLKAEIGSLQDGQRRQDADIAGNQVAND